MYRSHTCGELRITDVNKQVQLSGWVQTTRNFGELLFVDVRDRYGITQIVFNNETNNLLFDRAKRLGREFVIQAEGKVVERSNKNPKMPTGDIEILVSDVRILSVSKVPPFTIEDDTDGGDDIRMQYRYLDLRRNEVQEKIIFRHKVGHEVLT